MNLTVVAHQLRSSENLGSIARLMANFGFSQLTLSEPVTHDLRKAEALAVGAEEILQRMTFAPTLDQALNGMVFAIGTTSREALKRAHPLTPEEGIAQLIEHSARGPVALVLGGEKRGLDDEELSRCQEVIVIPTPGPQPSMNVSQAAAVMLYLCSRAERTIAPAGVEGARLGTVRALEAKIEAALLQCGFLNPQSPQHVLHELSRALVRGKLSQREAEIWLSAFEHVRRVTASVARSAD
jgi:tRNA/rRNA methyltransferase